MNEFEDDKLADELREQGFTNFEDLSAELKKDWGWRDHLTYHWNSWKYSAQIRTTTFLIRLAQRICNHMFCAIHQDDEGTYFEICDICGKELDVDD